MAAGGAIHAAMDLEEGLLEQLVPMGCSRELARRAVRATEYAGVDEALTWLGDVAAASGAAAESSFAASAPPHATDCDRDAVRHAMEADLALSGDEALRQAIDASLADERERRSQSALDSFDRLSLHAGERSDSPMPPPPPPRELCPVDSVAETILRRLHAKSVSPIVIVKAGLLLRRRAAAARICLQAERDVAERAGVLPGTLAPAYRLPTSPSSGSAALRPPMVAAAPVLGAAAPILVGAAPLPDGASPPPVVLGAPIYALPAVPKHGLTPYETAILRGQERLSERLEQLGLCRLVTKDDGNCQFRALSHQLWGTEAHHLAVRAAAVRTIRAGRNGFFGAIFGSAALLEEYLSEMAEPRTWGDEITIRATADAFDVTVHLITSNDENWYLQYAAPSGSPRKHLFLAYISPVHYEAIGLRADDTDGSEILE